MENALIVFCAANCSVASFRMHSLIQRQCALRVLGSGARASDSGLFCLFEYPVPVRNRPQMNCVFMPQHASLLEIHPKGFREHVWWYSMWCAQTSTRSSLPSLLAACAAAAEEEVESHAAEGNERAPLRLGRAFAGRVSAV